VLWKTKEISWKRWFWRGKDEEPLTGGQKSSWKSTTMRAGVKGDGGVRDVMAVRGERWVRYYGGERGSWKRWNTR
jgi:hypothetical protein